MLFYPYIFTSMPPIKKFSISALLLVCRPQAKYFLAEYIINFYSGVLQLYPHTVSIIWEIAQNTIFIVPFFMFTLINFTLNLNEK